MQNNGGCPISHPQPREVALLALGQAKTYGEAKRVIHAIYEMDRDWTPDQLAEVRRIMRENPFVRDHYDVYLPKRITG